MKRTMLIFGALLLLLPAAGGEETDLSALRSREVSERLRAVEALTPVPGDEVSSAIAKLLGDREERVVLAVLEALAERADAPSRKALRSALSRFAKDSSVLPVVVVSLGVTKDADAAKPVGKLARRALGGDPRLARACIDALGQMRDPASLRALMDLLASAEASGHGDYLEEIQDALRELTGLPFRVRETWHRWWRGVRKGWRPTPLSPAKDALFFRHDGWRFSIERPSTDRWKFEAADGTVVRIQWAGDREEARFAWLDVSVHAFLEGDPKTVEDAARVYREAMAGEFRDVRNAVFDVPVRFAGAPARRHSLTGIFRQGSVATWEARFLERNGLVYMISAGWESGASKAVRGEIDAILGSLTLLD